jgi:hypothetical protein
MNPNYQYPCVPVQNPAFANTKRLSRQKDWTRPAKTETDDINDNPEKQREKLENYVEVDNIEFVGLNTHVRYYVFDTRVGKYMFRLGGLLAMKHSTYVVLSNGTRTWSVPKESEYEGKTYKTRFFRVLTPYEMQEKKAEHNRQEKDQSSVVVQQQLDQLESQKTEIEKLKRLIVKMSNQNLSAENESVVASARRNTSATNAKGTRGKNI